MYLIFTLLTQVINETPFNLDFKVDHGRRLLPELGPGKARFAKTSRALRRPGKIRVLIDGKFTGIELDSQVILDYVRVVFRVDGDGDGDGVVLCVVGARENCGNDFLLRHRYFGCMRNFYWNNRPLQSIDRSDSKLATKLRNIEGHCRYLAPFVDITLQKRYPSLEKGSPRKDTRNPPILYKIIKTPPVQQERPRVDPRPLEPSVHFEKKERSRVPWPLDPTAEIRENGINSLHPNGTVTSQQVRPRDDLQPLGSLVDFGEQVRLRVPHPQPLRARDEPWPSDPPRPRDESQPLEPPTGESGIKSLQPNGTGTAQQARPRDDKSLTNVDGKDSFVHGLIIAFSLIFCLLLKCFF